MAIQKTDIRNKWGQIIAYLETDTDTGDKTLRNFYNQILGYYRASDNTTRDFYNMVIAKGDALGTLIPTDKM